MVELFRQAGAGRAVVGRSNHGRQSVQERGGWIAVRARRRDDSDADIYKAIALSGRTANCRGMITVSSNLATNVADRSPGPRIVSPRPCARTVPAGLLVRRGVEDSKAFEKG